MSMARRWSAQFDKFIEPFKRRYPFIKTQYTRTTGEALTTKILYEVTARQLGADVVLINNYTHRIFMKKNIITAYMAPTAANFPAGFTDKQGYWDRLLFGSLRDHLQHPTGAQGRRAEIFRRLLQPKWKGQISLEREELHEARGHPHRLRRRQFA